MSCEGLQVQWHDRGRGGPAHRLFTGGVAVAVAVSVTGTVAGSVGGVTAARYRPAPLDAPTSGEFQEEVAVDGGLRERVRVRTARSEMSDPRLTGTVTVTDNADRFIDGTELFLGDVLWGTIAIENDQGTWAGPLTGTSDLSANGRGVTYIELVGAGGYEGLSAVLFEREEGEEPNFEWDWNGVIFSGSLPPDR